MNSSGIPSEIYWNFVREFQPTEDRAVISKRCTTRYYGGERCPIEKDDIPFSEIDEERCFPRCYAEEDCCLPRIVGVAGEDSFDIVFDEKPEESKTAAVISVQEMEERLIEVRSAWDIHVSTIGSPSRRLCEALRIRRSFQLARACPLLVFPGCSVDDVINFHVMTGGKKMVLEGCVYDDPTIRPDTQLGFWVHKFLKSLAEDDKAGLQNSGSSETFYLRDVLAALLNAGSDVRPFFDPLQEFHDCPLELANRLFEPGMSYDHVLTMVSIHQSRHDDAMQGLCWLLQGLGNEYSEICPPRFTRGTWVECNLGDDHWHEGVVTSIWNDRFPYEVKLTCGRQVHAPFDYDEVIKKGTQRPLRFKKGDRVLCLMDDGWKRGVILSFWEHGFPYWVRVEDESTELRFAGVPFDLDDVVREDSAIDGNSSNEEDEEMSIDIEIDENEDANDEGEAAEAI